MKNQPMYKRTYKKNPFFADGMSVRPPVPGTVARGQLHEDTLLYQGKADGKYAEMFPFPATIEVLKRGEERYNIFCSVCHDRLGTGNGMVVQRGFKKPPSFHIDRLRDAAPGYFFDVITHGFGAMQDYSAQLTAEDRWAVIAYIRALQLSQRAALSDVPAAERAGLEAAKKA